MTPDDPNRDVKKSTAILSGVIVAAFTGIFLLVPDPDPVRHLTLRWNKNEPTAISELWGTTNLLDWYFVLETTNDWAIVPADKPQEFFKVRNRFGDRTNGIFSDWARKL